jgi:DNA-binding beta-propeller fold protein YncE
MSRRSRVAAACIVTVIAWLVGPRGISFGQSLAPNDYPNPYHLVENWAPVTAHTETPPTWPEHQVVGISFDPAGNMVLLQRAEPPLLVLDPTGQKLLRSYGGSELNEPHGWAFLPDGSAWVTDVSIKDGNGSRVVKFGPDGKVLLALGTRGVSAAGPESFLSPTGVVVARNGDVFVSDGHRREMGHRIVKFSKDGKFIKSWGTSGSEPGNFNGPHAIAIDSQGRLFVADRGNNRIQIFDQEGTLLEEWKQFGRPETILITADDTMYVPDTQSNARSNPGFKRGIRIGSARDGSVKYFLPDPTPTADMVQTSSAVALAVDGNGNLYTAEVWSNADVGMAKMVKKFEKK